MNETLTPGKREVKIGDWFSESMRLTLDNIGPHLVAGLVLFIVSAVLTVTVIGNFILAVPIWCGAFYYAKRRMLNQPAEVGDLFRGFDIANQAIVANLLVDVVFIAVSIVLFIAVAIPTFIIGLIGTCCLTSLFVHLPFLILSPLLLGVLFAFHVLLYGLLFDRRMNAMDALKLSYAFAWENAVQLSIYGILVMLLVAIGSALTFGLGLIFLAPFSMFACTVVYRDWIGFVENGVAAGTMVIPPEPPPAAAP